MSYASGYVMTMLAVVVLLPIAIMIAACLLERFEARTVAVDPPKRTPRAHLRAPRTPRLRVVADAVAAVPATIGLDAPTADLRKAS